MAQRYCTSGGIDCARPWYCIFKSVVQCTLVYWYIVANITCLYTVLCFAGVFSSWIHQYFINEQPLSKLNQFYVRISSSKGLLFVIGYINFMNLVLYKNVILPSAPVLLSIPLPFLFTTQLARLLTSGGTLLYCNDGNTHASQSS